MKPELTSPAFLVTAMTIVVGVFVLMMESASIMAGLLFAPFALGPLFVSLLVAAFVPYRSSQLVLVTGSILYGVWFGYVYLSAFYWHLDAQSSVGLLFAGVYSLPVMIPLWVVAWALNRRHWLRGG